MSEWRTIDSAPRDGSRIMLYIPRQSAYIPAKTVVGLWDVRDIQPYFTNDRERLDGVRITRKNQPTYWMPLPEPPSDATP